MPMLYHKQCVVCGRFYKPNKHNQVTCGDKNCQKERTRQLQLQKTLAAENKEKKKMALLTKEAIEARNLSMSYGQYKAAQWCRNKQYLRKYRKEVKDIVS